MKRRIRIGNSAGFTLTETMVVVVLLGIIAGITIPAFGGYMRRQRLVSARNELMADIQYARSLAIARRTTFQIQFTADQYIIIQPGPDTIMRTKDAPTGVTFTSDADPQFYPWGLADAAAIEIDGGYNVSNLTLLANGTVTHD